MRPDGQEPSRVRRLAGPSSEAPAQELIDAGFAWEIADAPLLHHGLNVADLGHVLDLRSRGLIPEPAAAELLRVLLDAYRTDPADFPYEASSGEVYNSRERSLRRTDRRLGRMAPRRPPPPGGRPRGAAVAAEVPNGAAHRGRSGLRFGRRRGRRRARRDVHGRPDLPPAGPAVHLRPLPAGVRATCPARRRAVLGSPGAGQREPRRRGLRQRQPAARRQGSDRPRARLRRRHRPHPRRHVADRRLHRPAGHQRRA